MDDDEVLRRSLSAVLSRAGYQVCGAADGFSALAHLRTGVPEVLISGLDMPGRSGFELLSVIRRRFPTMWVIAMSEAFAGSGVPPGVVADAFCEKCTELRSLLSTVGSFAKQQARPALQKRDGLVPVWVHESLHTASGDLFNIIPCPECYGGRAGSQPSAACRSEGGQKTALRLSRHDRALRQFAEDHH